MGLSYDWSILNKTRAIPIRNRLSYIKVAMVSELEALGYDLAHDSDGDIANSVFILSIELEARLSVLESTIEERETTTNSLHSKDTTT